MLNVKFILKVFIIFLFVNSVKCSIAGYSYIDPTNRRSVPNPFRRGEDPCNPLYWYPRNIPIYCEYKNFPISEKPAPSEPIPIPHSNFIIPIPALPATLPRLAPMRFGELMVPSNSMLPVASPVSIYPYAVNPYETIQQAGMVPGLPGLVTKDGGINILPFSDAYSDLLENHNNQMLRRRLQKLIQVYEEFLNNRSYRRLRKYARRNM